MTAIVGAPERLSASVALALALALAFAVSGCAGQGASGPASADCQSQVRAGGVVYTSYGHSGHVATKYATADAAECHDVGEDPAGSVFPDDPRQVTTWTFEGYPPEKVLGVRFDEDSLAVFLAESVPRDERDRILDALRKPAP